MADLTSRVCGVLSRGNSRLDPFSSGHLVPAVSSRPCAGDRYILRCSPPDVDCYGRRIPIARRSIAVRAAATRHAHFLCSLDTYSAGYEEGLRHGINRALMITPEREGEMREEISKADLVEVHLKH